MTLSISPGIELMQNQVAAFLDRHPKLFILTGAGVSMGSGIPTYRDHDGRWQRNQPVQHGEFLRQPAMRKRYWARSAVGWPTVTNARPNAAHYALAALEQQGRVTRLVTQNVDRLHQKAGSRKVIDLHGRLDRVLCLDCGLLEPRTELQVRLLEDNPHLELRPGELAPDGDAFVDDAVCARMREPVCRHCRGLLMPDVVFFGGSVPRTTVEAAYTALEESDAMLVVGSSLMVYSGFRFCKGARERGKPLLILNQGKTRADELADLKVEQPCAEVLAAVAG